MSLCFSDRRSNSLNNLREFYLCTPAEFQVFTSDKSPAHAPGGEQQAARLVEAQGIDGDPGGGGELLDSILHATILRVFTHNDNEGLFLHSFQLFADFRPAGFPAVGLRFKSSIGPTK